LEEELDFSVHPTTGVIYLVRPLDLTLGRKRQLVIYATDRERGGLSSLSTAKRINLAANTGSVLAQQSRALVNIHITQPSKRKDSFLEEDSFVSNSKLEVSLEDPFFSRTTSSSQSQTYHFSVPENSRFATILGQINETSLFSTLDSTSYHSINSNIINNHNYNKSLSNSGLLSSYRYKLLNFKSKFAIDSKSGIITVKGLIDREDKDHYRLHVSLTDITSGSSSLIPVVVSVTDVNDNPPRFRDKTYYTRVREDLPLGVVIMRMNAVDEDEGSGGVIKYSIKKESRGGDDKDSFFSIDERVGNIRIARELDYETKQVYNLTIIARDEGKPSFSSTAHLLIEVEDVDENQFSPKFGDAVVKGTVRENSPLRSHVMDVQAIDDDFQTSESGNDNHHHESRGQNKQLSPNSPRVTYKLVGGNGIGKFSLNEETGQITTSGNLDREKESRFWLTVTANDKSPIPKSSHVHVYIEVEDENDCSPRTLLPFYSTSISENASVGSQVLVLSAVDDDISTSDSSSRIVYRILASSEDSPPFSINNETGRITVKDKLDRELQAQYILDIEVSQVNPEGTSGHSLMSRTPVIINVDNVNDNPPQPISHIFRCQAYNSLPKEIPVCHVIAYDLDDSASDFFASGTSSSDFSTPSSSLVFEIEEGNDYSFFRIDKSLGSIYFSNDKAIPVKTYDLTVTLLFVIFFMTHFAFFHASR
jgi:protocadherin Fat 1/2/3